MELRFPALKIAGGLLLFLVAIEMLGQSQRWWQGVPVFVAIAVTALASFYILAAAERVRAASVRPESAC